MNLNRPRAMLALFAGALLAPFAAADSNNTTFALEWDAAAPEDNVAEYRIEAKQESSPGSGLFSWNVIGTQTPPHTTFTITGLDPADGPTEYRLKIVNTEGNFVIDPAIVTDYPTANLNFRPKVDPPSASIEKEIESSPIRVAFNIIRPEPTVNADKDAKEPDPVDLDEADRMLAEFRLAIAAPDPDPPSFDLFETFLNAQARGETPFAPTPPGRPETFAALFRG